MERKKHTAGLPTFAHLSGQGCQIVLGTTYQNGKYIPKDHKIYHMTTKNIYQMIAKCTE
jgi:hypothetical protein